MNSHRAGAAGQQAAADQLKPSADSEGALTGAPSRLVSQVTRPFRCRRRLQPAGPCRRVDRVRHGGALRIAGCRALGRLAAAASAARIRSWSSSPRAIQAAPPLNTATAMPAASARQGQARAAPAAGAAAAARPAPGRAGRAAPGAAPAMRPRGRGPADARPGRPRPPRGAAAAAVGVSVQVGLGDGLPMDGRACRRLSFMSVVHDAGTSSATFQSGVAPWATRSRLRRSAVAPLEGPPRWGARSATGWASFHAM